MPANRKQPKNNKNEDGTKGEQTTTSKKTEPESESTISYLYRMINHPQLKAIGADFMEKLIYLYFLYLFQRGVGATFSAVDSMLLGAFNAITGREAEVVNPGSLAQVQYAEDPQRRLTPAELREIVDLVNEAHRINQVAAPTTAIEEVFHTPPETPRGSPLRIMPEGGGMGLHGGALSYAALGAIGKEALTGLLLTALTAAVGTYAIKNVEDTKNLNYDAERTDPLYIAPKQAKYDIESRAKNWASEVKHKKQMSNILDEFGDVGESIDIPSHFTGTYGLGLKKGLSPKERVGKKKVGKKEPLKELPPMAIPASEEFKKDIEYARDNNLTGNTLKVFIATCLLAGVAWGIHDSISEEYSIDHGKILSDIISKNISLSGVVNYVNSMFATQLGRDRNRDFERGLYFTEEEDPYYPGNRGGGVKKKGANKEADSTLQPIPETFYQKRIKPIANKIYNVVTSDETITVAKALAQLAFLTALMYGIKELGTTAYSSMALENQDPRTSRQVLEELAEQEIARPTYYTEASGRNRGQVTEYDKSDYPREWPKDVGSDNPYSEEYNPTISKINRILGEAGSDIYRNNDQKIDQLIKVLKKEDPVHIKNLMLQHPVLTDISAKKPHRFTTEFAEHFPTEDEIKQFKKLQKASGKGLKEDTIKLSKETMSKLKKMAKKIYDKMKSEEGQMAVKGLTTATILAGLTALLHSRMGVSTPQLSPQELKEQYMESIGESVLF